MFDDDKEFSIKSLFVPLTNLKAVNFIIIVGLIVYSNMLFNGFVLDDKTFIQFNPDLFNGNFISLLGNNSFNSMMYYRPVIAIYFALIHFSVGDTTFFYHSIQLVIHILNVLFVYLLLRKFLMVPISLFLSLVFLVHPMQVEAVSYIVATDDMIFFAFGMAALLICAHTNLNHKNIIFASVLLFLSLMTKEAGFLFIPLIAIFLILFQKKNSMRFLHVSGFVVVLYASMRFFVGHVFFQQADQTLMSRISMYDRLITMPNVILYYFRTFLFPLHLIIDQQWFYETIDFRHTIFPLMIDSLLGGFIIFIGNFVKGKNLKLFFPYIFFTSWLCIGLAIHTQIFPLDVTVSDRWFYFPMVGLLGMIGVSLQTLHFSPPVKRLGFLLGVSLLAILSLRTMVRNSNYQDAFTLYKHDIQIQSNFDLENALGVEYLSRNEYANAILHFKNSVAQYPYEVTYSNLANAYLQSGDLSNAKKYYSETLHAKYTSPKLHQNVLQDAYEKYVMLVVATDSPEKSLTLEKSSLQVFPASGKLWAYEAISLSQLHDKKTALQAAENAKKFMPGVQTERIYQQVQEAN